MRHWIRAPFLSSAIVGQVIDDARCGPSTATRFGVVPPRNRFTGRAGVPWSILPALREKAHDQARNAMGTIFGAGKVKRSGRCRGGMYEVERDL